MKIHLIPLSLLSSFVLLPACGKTGGKPAASVIPPPTQDSVPKKPAQVDSLFAWQKIDSFSGSSRGIEDIWFTSQTKGNLISDNGSIYQSLDGGKSWSVTPNSASSILSNLFFVDNTYGFAQGGSQIEITRDGGSTWSTRGLPGSVNTNAILNVYFSSRSTGYVTQIGVGLFKTVDTGSTWQQVYSAPGSGKIGYYPYFFNDNEGYVFSGDGSFAKTADGAASWQPVTQNVAVNNNANPSFNALQFLDSLTGYYGCRNGVLKTTDGGMTWNSVYPTGSFVNVIKFFTANSGYYKSDSAIYKTTDGGHTWTTSCRLASDLLFGMNFVDSTHGWACTGNGYVLRISQ